MPLMIHEQMKLAFNKFVMRATANLPGKRSEIWKFDHCLPSLQVLWGQIYMYWRLGRVVFVLFNYITQLLWYSDAGMTLIKLLLQLSVLDSAGIEVMIALGYSVDFAVMHARLRIKWPGTSSHCWPGPGCSKGG